MLNEADFGMNTGLDMPDASSGDVLSGLKDELNFGQSLSGDFAIGAASVLDSLQDSGQTGWLDLAELA